MRFYSNKSTVYSVDLMFVYLNRHKHKVTEINVDSLIDQTKYKGWFHGRKKISPMNVINNPKLYKEHMKRIKDADLSFPIIMNKGYIIDGMHRLMKSIAEGHETISAYVFDAKLMKKFKIGTIKDFNIHDFHLEEYELIEIYLDRFT